jgi:hypothetical protein
MPLAGRDGVELEVALELRGRALDRGELEAVARALKSLYSPERVLMEGASPGPSDNAALTATLAETLEHWLERRAGLQCHLLVRSASSPPRPLLQALVAAVFHRCPGEWLEASASGADADAELLDLADCRPLGIPAPPIAPPPDYFAAAGHMDSADPYPGTVPESGVLLGVTRQGDRDVPVRFASSDRARHCYVIGATGTGKSTLLSNMVLQDIRDGAGVCVLDPHGDLQADLMSAIPGSRAADVIPIDLADPDRAIGLNLLEARGSSSRQQVSFAINEILSMFWRLYASIPESMGPAFEQYMRNTLMALAENSRGAGTLADVMLFYENQDFRNAVLGSCSNPAAVSFFRGIAAKTTGEASFQNIAPYITNKLNRFVGSDYVRPIIAQSRSTLDLRECMDTGKVLLVNLNKGALGGTECSLVGMLLLAKIFSAALERAGQPRADRRPFHLYVDEAQNFLTPIVGSILAEARKFGLTMTLANQNFAQWQDRSSLGLLDSILGNVGTLLMFRVGIDEAERLKSFTRPEFDTRDLQYLPDRTVIAKLLAHGRPLPPFTFATLAPMTHECANGVNEVLSMRLRRNFEQVSRPRDEVETEWREAHRAGHPDQRKTVQ